MQSSNTKTILKLPFKNTKTILKLPFKNTKTILKLPFKNTKQNILNEYKGNLLDIGSGNGGDIHKWKHFRKIAYITNRITIYPNTIQNIKLKDTFNIVTDIEMLFMDYSLFNSDIDSPYSLDEESPVHLIGTLRYVHKECDNITFVNIENSNLTKHYENAINSEKNNKNI
ncbi:hypothetical protein U3516DRAFT_732348 [Neocallimastix sp. 'constans']